METIIWKCLLFFKLKKCLGNIIFASSKRCFTDIQWVPMKESCRGMPFDSDQFLVSQKLKYWVKKRQTSTIFVINSFVLGFSHDLFKIQTKKLSIPLSFLLLWGITVPNTNFGFQRVLLFAIEDAWISRLLRDAAFAWRAEKLLCGLKTLLIFWDFAI